MTVRKRILKMIYLGIQKFQDPYYQGIAAQVAFFFILSIVPILLLLSQLLGMLNLSMDFIGELVGDEIIISGNLTEYLESLLTFEPQTTTNIILIIAAVWAASRIQFTLMRITNYTFTEGKDAGNFLRDRARSLLTVVITVVSVVLIVVVQSYGGVILRFLTDRLLISESVDKLWKILRWPIAGAIYILVVSFNYYVLPSNRRKFKDILPGSIFAAVGMLIVTMGYSLYTSRAVNNNVLYGSMASIAVLMFWFYLISWVLCLGIVVNKVWWDTRGES